MVNKFYTIKNYGEHNENCGRNWSTLKTELRERTVKVKK